MRSFRMLLLAFFLFAGSLIVWAQDAGPIDAVYIKMHQNWQRDLTRWKLRKFVPLIGLHLLHEGENTFGKNPENDIVIDSKNAPEFMGMIIKKGKKISFKGEESVLPELNGEEVLEMLYTFDEDRNSEQLRFKFIRWYVQYVGDDFFLRVSDDTSPLVAAYQSQDFYEPSSKFILPAVYKEFRKPKKEKLKNVIATEHEFEFIGEAVFLFEGKKYKLWLLPGYFLMFGDETNGQGTFPYGRYLRVSPPDEEGQLILDFNYAFSPPRSSSLFTTCEFPPVNNMLPFAIEAGEKYEMTGEEIIRPVQK